jgi:hypothetical protein
LRSRERDQEEPHDDIREYLMEAGLLDAALTPHLRIYIPLIDALVERWRPETHTFWFPCGETTITLEDVAMIMGLRADGMAVTGRTTFAGDEAADLCREMLGSTPQGRREIEGNFILDTFIEDRFRWLNPLATEAVKQQYARAYILMLFSRRLFPSPASNRVHVKFLHLMRDKSFAQLGEYSWGSAVLATLYRGLDRASHVACHDIGGCMTLLQSWAFYRIPHLAPIPETLQVWPFARR